MANVGVVGTTSWGTTLAILLARQGHDVHLLARAADEASELAAARQNPRFMPGVPFPTSLAVTASAREALGKAELVILAVPSRALRENVRNISSSLAPSTIIVSATKGLELGTGKRMSQVLEEEIPTALQGRICVLSGPNLSGEIIAGKPSSTVIASRDADAARTAQALITSPRFRVYTNEDVTGVELCGALKNIIALGAGICDGLQYGNNAKAAFMTRGLAEIVRLGVAARANPLTFAGLAGMGDLIATCSSPLSRNRYVGEQLAKGRSLEEIRRTMKNVAEGIDTTSAALALSGTLGVEMPITQATYDVLFGGIALDMAISGLLGRAPGPE